ncbi:fimbrial protein [Lonsdalea quercina]|uniref:fimbrial protein n=1 Tax=Lonsdalea quercina TaxID=71657 RepID=UPI003976CFF5
MLTRLLFTLLFLFPCCSALANSRCGSGESSEYAFLAYAGAQQNKTARVNIFQGLDNLVIDPHLPIGGVVYSESIETTSTDPLFVMCGDDTTIGTNPNFGLMVGNSSFSLISDGSSTMLDIGIDGLALKVESSGDQIIPAFSFPRDTSLSRWGITLTIDSSGEWQTNFSLNEQSLGFGHYTFSIVKTGDTVSPGTSSTGTVMEMTLPPESTVFSPLLIFSLASPINVTNSCSVTNSTIDVDLGIHSLSEFTGMGSSTNGSKFGIDVACSGPITANITLEDNNTAYNSENGVLGLSSEATASGIGVQVLDSGGNVIPLSISTKASSITTGGNQTIELQARLYQTAPSVTVGSIDASATFTLDYE